MTRYITTTQVADRAGVHPATARRWAQEGKLAWRVKTAGGRYRFDPAVVEAFLTPGKEVASEDLLAD